MNSEYDQRFASQSPCSDDGYERLYPQSRQEAKRLFGFVPKPKIGKTRKRGINTRRRRLLEINPTCYYCRKLLAAYNSTLDHKLPRARGGTGQKANLVLCCIPCNRDKGTMTAEEFLKSMTITEE